MLGTCQTVAPIASLVEAASGRQWDDDMSQRTRPAGRTTSTAHARCAGTRVQHDDRLNQQISDALRQAAQAREARDQRKTAEDAIANERETVALRALIDRGLGAGSGPR
jgi:hypothetical protein